MAKYRKYSKEFQLQAAKLVTEQGYSYKKAAQRLGGPSPQWKGDNTRCLIETVTCGSRHIIKLLKWLAGHARSGRAIIQGA